MNVESAMISSGDTKDRSTIGRPPAISDRSPALCERQLSGERSGPPCGCSGSGPDSQSGELAACLPSFELLTPIC
jgi:hypothetical protein